MNELPNTIVCASCYNPLFFYGIAIGMFLLLMVIFWFLNRTAPTPTYEG